MKSRPIFQFVAWVSLALLFSATAEEEAKPFPLDQRPTYQTLTSIGLKLLNPDPNRAHMQGQGIEFKADPVPLVFTLGGLRSGTLDPADYLNASFSGRDLAPVGKYYPPPMPVQDTTPVSYFSLRIPRPGLADARATLASMEKVFQLDMVKVDAWIQHRFWESHPVLQLNATIPGGTASISLSHAGGPQQDDCNIFVSLSWGGSADPSAPGHARPLRPRALPQPQPGAPGQ